MTFEQSRQLGQASCLVSIPNSRIIIHLRVDIKLSRTQHIPRTDAQISSPIVKEDFTNHSPNLICLLELQSMAFYRLQSSRVRNLQKKFYHDRKALFLLCQKVLKIKFFKNRMLFKAMIVKHDACIMCIMRASM